MGFASALACPKGRPDLRLPADALLIYAASNGTYLPSNDDVKFNGNLSIPFEAGKTYRIRVLKYVLSFFALRGVVLTFHDAQHRHLRHDVLLD